MYPNESFDLLTNGSLFKAVHLSYSLAWGVWFWPIILFATIGLVALTSKNPALVAVATIIGNVTLFSLLPVQTSIIFYLMLVLGIGLTLYMFFGSAKTD